MSLDIDPFSNKLQGVITNSKKITKIKSSFSRLSNNSQETLQSQRNSKKYKTFENHEKTSILLEIKRRILKTKNSSSNFDDNADLYGEDLLKDIEGTDLNTYNQILKEVLLTRVKMEPCEVTHKSLMQWRKKIKGWLYTFGKPETRGNPLVTGQRLEIFKIEVSKIIENLKYRSFNHLRQEILKVLERFHREDEFLTGPKTFDPKVCSKHWWFNFLQKHPDIKAMWESLSLKRHRTDEEKSSSSEQEKVIEQENTEIQSLYMKDPVFSIYDPQSFKQNDEFEMTDRTVNFGIDATSFQNIQKMIFLNLFRDPFCRYFSMRNKESVPKIPRLINTNIGFNNQRLEDQSRELTTILQKANIEAKQESQTLIKNEEELIKQEGNS